MPEYIDLGKTPQSEQERQELIMEIIKSDEVNEQEGLNIIQKNVFDFLTTRKGFPVDSISANKKVKVFLPDTEFTVPIDLVISIDNTFVMAIKCAINSVESWERYSLALGRTLLDDYQIPFTVVTDSEVYILIDVLKSEVISRDKNDILSYDELSSFIKAHGRPLPYNQAKMERERRILHAFNAIRCSDGVCD